MDLKDKDLYIDNLAKVIHNANVEKGFWPENKQERNKSEILMLIVSELAEAQEALRDNHFTNLTAEQKLDMIDLYYRFPEEYKKEFESKVKNSFEDELIDSLIRTLDAIEGFGIDLNFHLRGKLYFNSLRPHKHGKVF
jgi:NTP pyrophosphatase (non-canonical NTP hydrolase)